MDRPKPRPQRHWFLTIFTTIGLVAAALAPLAAVGTWLLLTDPEVAGDVASDGRLLPLAIAIVRTLGRAVISLLGYL